MEHGQLTETERVALIFGVAVGRRFVQRVREMPQIEMQALVALAAADIYQVMVESDDPLRAVDDYLSAEEMMAE